MVTESETALLAEPEAGPESLADRVLLERFVIGGDREAMSEVLDRHWATAMRVARRYTGNDSDAEDCVQEALLRACRAAGQYSGRGTVRAWLLQAVVNACRMRFREEDARSHRQRVVGESEGLLRRSEGPDLEVEEQRELVRAAVAALPERYRVPLWMRYVEDLTPQEVARTLERSEATVRSQIHRGLKQITTRLTRSGAVLAVPALLGLLGELAAAEPPLPPPPGALAAGALPAAEPALAVAGGGLSALGGMLVGGGLVLAGTLLGLVLSSLGDDAPVPATGLPPPVVATPDSVAPDSVAPDSVAPDSAAEEVSSEAAPARDPDLLYAAAEEPGALRRYRARLTTEDGRATGHASDPVAVELELVDTDQPRLGIILDARAEAGTTETLVITQAFSDEPALALDCRLRLPTPPTGDDIPLQLTALLRTQRPAPAPRRVLEVHPEVLRASGLLSGDWVAYRAELEHCQDDGALATELRYYLADQLYMRTRIELRSDHLLPLSITDQRLEILDLRVRRARPTLSTF